MKEESWIMLQLGVLERTDSESFAYLLKTIQAEHPQIFEEMVLKAVESEDLGVSDAADLLLTDSKGVDSRLEIYRQEHDGLEVNILIETNEKGVAEIVETGAKVWEIVLKYRELGSIEALRSSYFGLTQSELRAALKYAERYPEEIDKQISAYLKIADRLKTAYPFS